MIINISGDISLIEANDAASYVQELAGDDANIIFGAMYDENAQDEASITVIATGLDEHNSTSSVTKAMAGFTNFKPKAPAAASAAQTERAAAPEAAATASAGFTRPAQPSFNRSFGQQSAGNTAPSLLLPDLDREQEASALPLQLPLRHQLQPAATEAIQQLRPRIRRHPSGRLQIKKCRSIFRIF